MNNTTRLASVNITNSKRLIPLRLILMGALAYLSIPALLFLIGFCKVWISGLVGLGMVVSLTFAIIGKNDHCERASGDVAFSYSFIGVVFIVSLLWCIICGQGGLVVQKWDWNFRNACFRDLITHLEIIFYWCGLLWAFLFHCFCTLPCLLHVNTCRGFYYACCFLCLAV